MTRIVIVGAGMAGLAAAERLRAHGQTCVIFDKSRGFGGRMATRRTGDLQFDHGAQYFSARSPDFVAQVARWREAGLVDDWSGGAFVGAPSMTAPARSMAANHECVTEAHVSSLSRTPEGWSVRDYAGLIPAGGNGSYEAVVLAVPAPQAAPLAASAGVHMPELDTAEYAPCIALMLAFPPETRCALRSWMKTDDSMIAWIARNDSKPGRPKGLQTWVIHARPDWSRVNLETDAEALRAPLLARFQALTGVHSEPMHASAHRWRYALVEKAVGEPCLFDEKAMVGACGDWCLGPRVEAAFESGRAMADRLLRALA